MNLQAATTSKSADATATGLAVLQEALRQTPDDPIAFYRLGRELFKRHREQQAVLCYRQALRLKPDFADAHKHLGNALRWCQSTPVDEAVASLREAIRLEPGDAEAHHMLGRTLKDMGRLDEAVLALRRACELRPESARFHSGLLYCLHFHPDSDPSLLTEEHDRWNQRHAAPLASCIQPHLNEVDPDRRLRVGYVSPYFSDHPIGRFLLPLFAAHDARAVETFCYAAVECPDALTRQIRAHSHHWRETSSLSDSDLADIIRRDRIDILVELDAHMGENRLLTFARKPAPVQVTYLAYCSTTGLRTIDYRLTDPFLDPPGHVQPYVEESLWLPETYWCYQPYPRVPDVAPPPVLVNGFVTFGCLNNFWKVTLPTLAAWRDVLEQVPESRLMLLASLGTHRDRVRSFFAAGGIDPDRLAFVGLHSPSRYFGLYSEMDIALDPFPYGGGTTTCDALWMGVPVISLVGKTAVGRGGLSILSNVGLPELIARSPEEYVSLSARLAGDLPRLGSLRAGMRDRLRHSPLTDAPRFARHVEAAYRTMWQRWCAGAARA